MSRVEYRNAVVSLYVSAADAAYWDFRTRLSQEMKGSAFGSNVAILFMNSVSVVSGNEARRALAAGSAFFAGTQASISRDLFIERTLPTVLTAMDSARTEIKTSIVTKSRLDADQYSLAEAMDDIRRLEDQARLEAAFERLSQGTGALAADEREKLEAAYTVEVQGSLAQRKSDLLDQIEAADDSTVGEILQMLGAAGGLGRAVQIGSLRAWVDQNISSDAGLEAAASKVDLAIKRGELRKKAATVPDDKLAAALQALGASPAADVAAQRAAVVAWIATNVQSAAAYDSAAAALTPGSH